MKVLVNTPTGNIGSVLTAKLLDAGADVVLIARNLSKVKKFSDRGATVRQGDLEDRTAVAEATKGVDTLFWLTPPNFTTTDLPGFQAALAENAAAAVRDNGIGRVLIMSSIGAQHPKGTGPIAGLHHVEKKLAATDARVLNLRPAYFMENMFNSAQGIATDNGVFMAAPGDATMEMVATRDIAKEAARLITGPDWDDGAIVELAGPDPVSFGEATLMLGEALGRDLEYVQVTPEQAKSAMLATGLNEHLVELYMEMFEGFANGLVAPETDMKRGSTTFRQFANEVFRPAFEAMTGAGR